MTIWKVQGHRDIVGPSFDCRASLPVVLRSHVAMSSLSNSISMPPVRRVETERMSPLGSAGSWILARVSFTFLVMSAGEELGGNVVHLGCGLSRICQALMAALPRALSTIGGRCKAAIELYVGRSRGGEEWWWHWHW